jgi:hypothetical protein
MIRIKNADMQCWLAKESNRGETKPSPERGDLPSGNEWYISPTERGIVGLKYKLKRGLQPTTEKLKFEACGLGTKVTARGDIQVDGLEILVKPRKPKLKPGEDTRIDIEFVKVSPRGDRKAVPGKEIQLKIEGLKNGVISPKDKVSTNAQGKATLTYQAGQSDRSVRITAFYQPQNFPDKAEGSAVVLVNEGKGDLEVQINGSLNWKGESKDKRGTITTNFTINGTMSLKTEKHGGDYENYEIENLQVTYAHHAAFHNTKPDKNCPETLFLEVHGESSAQIQKGRIIIRYPREKSGLRKQGEIDFLLSSGPFPTKWKSGCGGNRTENHTTSIGVKVIDQKSSIAKNQQEFSGSRTFGISDFGEAFYFAIGPGLSFSYNDNESKEFSYMPKELEKIIAEKGGSVEQMRKLGVGIKEGNNGRLTWKIRKLKKRD